MNQVLSSLMFVIVIVIAPGELVLKETCLCWGPNHDTDTALCLECLVATGDQCSECGYPLCSQHQHSHPGHETECEVLTHAGVKIQPGTEDFSQYYPVVEVIR